jgi:serine phosphatase RsbU (regulator of sigma subunit)
MEWMADGYSDVVLDYIEREVVPQDMHVVCFVGGLEAHDVPIPRRHIPLAYADRNNIDAVLVVSLGNALSSAQLASYFSRFEPLPIASVAVQWEGYPTVGVDNQSGVREGVAHLILAHGRTRFACIRGPELSKEADQRFHTFAETLEAHSISFDPALLATGMYIKEHAVDAVHVWLDERRLAFDALVAANDIMALGAMEELTRRGIRVPEEVSVFGFDDYEGSRYAKPPLSTVRQPTALHVKKSVELVLRQLAGEKVPQFTLTSSELVLRRSCGCEMTSGESTMPPALVGPQRVPAESIDEQLSLLAAVGNQGHATKADRALVDAFETAVTGGRSEGFLRHLNTRLEQSSGIPDLVCAFRVLTDLHRHADSKGAAGTRQRGRLFDEIAKLLAETAERTQVGQRYRAEQRFTQLVRASEALAQAVDFSAIQAVLERTLPQFGIRRCFVCIFEGENVPATWARLVVAYDRSRQVSLPEGGMRFAASELLPDNLLSAHERTTWLVCPMLRRDPIIPGYVIFERSVPDAYVYDGLLDQIGSAYKRVHLLQRIVEEVRLREIAERERIEKEMQVAAQIQRGILPSASRVDGLEFCAAMQPATEVSGDYYDIIPVSRGCWIGIGDVTGHGLPTGMVVLMVQSSVSSLVRQNPQASPRDVIALVNGVLFDNIRQRMHQDEHVTLTLLRYASDGSVTFAGAHEDMLVYRAQQGTVEQIPTSGVWLGILPDIQSKTNESACMLREDDVLLLYTDGITEARDGRFEQFGVERLAAALMRLHAEPVEQIRDGILDEVRAWTRVQPDDMTLVVARQGRRQLSDEA